MDSKTCSNCEETRQEASLPPQLMTYIGETERNKIPVYACPTCDGQRLIDLASRTA